MEQCPNCRVRFKRYIFKECPGCGIIGFIHITGNIVYILYEERVVLNFDKAPPCKDLVIPGWKGFGGH